MVTDLDTAQHRVSLRRDGRVAIPHELPEPLDGQTAWLLRRDYLVLIELLL